MDITCVRLTSSESELGLASGQSLILAVLSAVIQGLFAVPGEEVREWLRKIHLMDG